MNDTDLNQRIGELETSLGELERRLGKVEIVLGMDDSRDEHKAALASPLRDKQALEMAVGQNLFARIGIVVLTIGGILTLSMPWAGVMPLLPSVVGAGVTLCLFGLAHLMQSGMPLNARYFRGSGMALLFFAALRLCHFMDPPYLQPGSLPAAGLLAAVVAVNLAVGWWRGSVFLSGMAIFTGQVAALAVGITAYVLVMLSLMALWSVWISRRQGWVWLPVLVIPLTYMGYFIWAIGNPVVGNPVAVVEQPLVALALLLAWMVIHACTMAFRTERSADGLELQVATFLNCGGYLLFLGHSLMGFDSVFAPANIVASLVLLGLAVMFWLREKSYFATFLYAMTGYTALTAALISLSGIPELFVWLSAQSLLVVVTAIWFRSRFIIVANFLIYLGVITGYMVLVSVENGISLVFVWVALTSARILKWQKDRLQLKTELMRNAYLASAFIVFPYALYHIVPPSWVAASWVGIALFYYLMNMVTKANKYRWMGHNTLLLTVAYIIIRSIGSMEGTQRVLSFLLLGTVLLVVSLVFTMMHSRKAATPDAGDSGDGDDDGEAGG